VAEAGAAIEYRGLAFRHCSPRHVDLQETMAASRRAGGRFNPSGEFGALYVSLDRETVRRELIRRAERTGVRLSDLVSRALLTLRIRLGKVLDLTNSATRRRWSISLEDLRGEDQEVCHAVARRARRMGYEAIRYPSATGAGENLAILLDSLESGSSVEIERRDTLDPATL
jgi:RES domain-containing protein